MSSPSRWPSLFPPRIYELTYRMLEHAVHAELADLTIINLTENADTCGLIVDQLIALADCILDRRSSPPWPPTAQVFPPGESVILPAWTTAAMLVSLLPDGARAWQDHLQMIWDLETTDGMNYSALTALQSRARRR